VSRATRSVVAYSTSDPASTPTSPARCARALSPRKNGKRGGHRVIYYYFNEALPVYLLAVYPKNQQVDLTPQQKARLISLGAALKAEALKRARARRVPRRG
jgi:hypothetical protein